MNLLRSAAFMLGAIIIAAAAHAYLHTRLVRDTELPPRTRKYARIGLVFLASLFPIGMIELLSFRTTPTTIARPLMGVVFVWVGLLFFLLLGLFVGEIARVATRFDGSRRRALARIIGGVSGIASLALGGRAIQTAFAAPNIRRERIELRRMRADLSGYKIVQLSDLHVGPALGRAFVADLVARANALEPDLVALTGDLVDGGVEQLASILAPLADLRARDGVYFVTGNHEFLSGVEAWLAFLPSLGIRVLRNEHVSIAGDGGFDLVGVDDSSGETDLPRAISKRDTTRAAILLAHRPDAITDATLHGIDLQLSGHTHGGQIAPLGMLERLHQPYVYGRYAVGDTILYVTSGAGFWGPPMRLGTHGEIAVFELVGLSHA